MTSIKTSARYTSDLINALYAANEVSCKPAAVIDRLTSLADQNDPDSQKLFNLIALVLEKHKKDGDI